MATSSFFVDVIIKDKKTAEKMIDEMDRPIADVDYGALLSRKCTELTGDDINKFFQ